MDIGEGPSSFGMAFHGEIIELDSPLAKTPDPAMTLPEPLFVEPVEPSHPEEKESTTREPLDKSQGMLSMEVEPSSLEAPTTSDLTLQESKGNQSVLSMEVEPVEPSSLEVPTTSGPTMQESKGSQDMPSMKVEPSSPEVPATSGPPLGGLKAMAKSSNTKNVKNQETDMDVESLMTVDAALHEP